MAKVTFTPLLDGTPIIEMYPGFMTVEVNNKETKATFEVFEENDNKIILVGENIKFNGEVFTGGRIEKIMFTNGENDPYLTIDGDYKVKQLGNAYNEGGLQGLIDKLFEDNDNLQGSNKSDYMLGFGGNDKLDGNKGADWLGGGAGRDVLTGGGGNDIFIFADGQGRDVINDFDAVSSDDKMDLIWIQSEAEYTIGKNANNDAVISFEDGSTLTLEGVRKNQIGEDDFYIQPS
jgi:Ca2+-binding RTX toxin-like protein